MFHYGKVKINKQIYLNFLMQINVKNQPIKKVVFKGPVKIYSIWMSFEIIL